MLLVLVIPHEWGHMMVAKKCGVKVLEFSAGMGPLLFKKQKGILSTQSGCCP
jgi:regulator of sigma E protease